MLVLKIQEGEEFYVGEAKIKIMPRHRIAIEAPRHVPIRRGKLGPPPIVGTTQEIPAACQVHAAK